MNTVGRFMVAALGWVVYWLGAAGAAELGESPAFKLERWDRQGSVALSDFAGKVVVLDFFAYWCAPCQKASSEIESKIRAHYALRQGNPQGVEVVVLSVNVEAEHRAKTASFIEKHRLALVVDDTEGKTLRSFGGVGLPHLVVIDGTAGSREVPRFRVVYRKGGFEGVEKLRAVIDRLGSGAKLRSAVVCDGAGVCMAGACDEEEADAIRVSQVLDRLGEQGLLPQWASLGEPVMDSRSDISEEEDSSAAVAQRVSLAFDGALSSDIQLMQESASYRIGSGMWELTLTGGLGTIGADYVPVDFDFLGKSTRLDELRGFGQLSGRWQWGERLTVVGGGGLYDGFADYRSVWLSEYYRQQFSTLPGYESPNPSGHNVSGGVRWEYWAAVGFAQLEVGYLADRIAPGYEIDFEGLRQGRTTLHTTSWRISLENVLHRRLRVLHEFRRIDTSDRDSRLGYQGTANFALGERWVARVQGGLSSEEPQFESWYAGATLEYELAAGWLVSVSARYYEDTGEIENSNFTNAAPPLEAWQAGLGLRYVGDGWAFKLFAAPYSTRYGAFGIGTAFFANLYRDRGWGLVQAALDWEFQ
jgi:thiol-disulfide isomerase/thioredoxin